MDRMGEQAGHFFLVAFLFIGIICSVCFYMVVIVVIVVHLVDVAVVEACSDLSRLCLILETKRDKRTPLIL